MGSGTVRPTETLLPGMMTSGRRLTKGNHQQLFSSLTFFFNFILNYSSLYFTVDILDDQFNGTFRV